LKRNKKVLTIRVGEGPNSLVSFSSHEIIFGPKTRKQSVYNAQCHRAYADQRFMVIEGRPDRVRIKRSQNLAANMGFEVASEVEEQSTPHNVWAAASLAWPPPLSFPRAGIGL
jgi:hypothetical protein